MRGRIDFLGERLSARARRRGAERDDHAEPRSDQPPVARAHQEELEHQMDLVRVAIELEGAADFGGDGAGADSRERHRESFLAHFGELAELLAQWNEAVERVRAAPGALWSWLERAARKRGISEPPYAVGGLIDRVATVTTERARTGQLDVPHQLRLERFADRAGGAERMGLLADGQNVMAVPGEQPAVAERALGQAERAIQALFDEAQRCKQAAEVGNARDAMLDVKQPLLLALAQAAAQEPIKASDQCPICRLAAELDTEPNTAGAGPAA